MNSLTITTFPGGFQWKNQPLDWKVGQDGTLSILAGKHTDWFIDPGGKAQQDSAPSALFVPPEADFTISSKVAVDFASTFDAGGLQIRESEECWAKLCLEYSPQGQPMIVSVVTRGKSDDCNSVAIPGREVWLRAAVTQQTIAFHYSLDGTTWQFVRYFTLGKLENLRVGFSAQSPMGKGCSAVFSDIQYRVGILNDLRNGE